MTRQEFEKNILPISRNLYRFAFRFLSSREEAEDTVQETFIKLWNMRSKLGQYRSVEALAMTVCRNRCLDLLRKRGREINDDFAAENVVADTNPQTTMEGNETLSKVSEIVESLPENYRTVLKMRDIEGYDYDDIADVMGVSVNLLRVNLSRARKIVREKLNELYYESARTKSPS